MLQINAVFVSLLSILRKYAAALLKIKNCQGVLKQNHCIVNKKLVIKQ